ncbi:hemolysin secretion protein D [Bacteroidia bacterium]|nr:hemolysin secretion protein D [Bacteroidia bacterium]
MTVSLFVACSNKQGTEKQEKIIPVKVMTVETGRATSLQRTYIGTVEESLAVSLAFASMGTVEKVLVSEGQQVRKGQLLATLNAATAENSYQMMLAKQQQAQDAYDRLVKVHENGSLPDVKFVEVKTGLQQAVSMTAVAKKNLDDCRMLAPCAGVIATRSVETGTNAMPGVEAFKLISVDKVNVKIPVPENEISKMKEGQKAQIEVTALGNAAFTGKIEMKGVVANAVSHTYEVKISVDNNAVTGGNIETGRSVETGRNAETGHAPSLLPGMVCKVSIEEDVQDTKDAKNVGIVVPNRTVQIAADGRQFVWLADGNVAKRQFVKTGGLTDSGIEIVEGISAGDKLIVEGLQKISEGMKIKFSER